MRTVLVSLTLLSTIAASMLFGVVAGYGVILGILKLVARQPREKPPSTAPALAAANAR